MPIEALAKLVSVGTLLAFAIVCGGVLVLRWREPDRERPFRVPGSPGGAALGIASCLSADALAAVANLDRGWPLRGSWGW